MHVTKIRIQSLRSIRKLVWEIPADAGAGWHVILGPNGSGKSSFVQGVSLCLLGKSCLAVRRNTTAWIHNGHPSASVSLTFAVHETWDRPSQQDSSFYSGWRVHRSQPGYADLGGFDPDVREDKEGFFSSAFGPYRRFGGSNREYEEISKSVPHLGRHLPVFEESFVLAESLAWLQELKFKQLEGDAEGQQLGSVIEFINQPGFLPFGARLEDVTSSGVFFVDGAGCRVPIEELSDGYRSILSLTLELIRQLSSVFGGEKLFRRNDDQSITIQPPGLVLIDEIDAHLHPSWQREIGFWFRRHFPSLQFIVTTHSPLICQAASDGSVFVLPAPGSEEEGRMLHGTALKRLIYGNVLEAYASGAFGRSGDRSEEAEHLLNRLADLNISALEGSLSEAELAERDQLRAIFATEPHPLAKNHVAGP